MPTILNTHGTNPNALNGQFLPFDRDCFYDFDEGFKPEPKSWVTLDDTVIHCVGDASEAKDLELYEESILDFNESESPASDYDPEKHFTDMALEAGLDPSDFYVFNPEDQETIIEAWVKMTYGAYFDTSAKQATNFDLTQQPVTHAPAPCYQYGCNRAGRGTTPWQVIDENEHKIWMGRRRGKGLQRAPKWQQEAGGRRQARQGLREKRIVLNAD